MPATMQNTVERLDKPSAYYLGKVRTSSPLDIGYETKLNSLFNRIRSVGMVVTMMMLADRGHPRSLRIR